MKGEIELYNISFLILKVNLHFNNFILQGAGDAFVGALAYFISHHSQLSMSEKIRRACQVASVSVQAPGTQSSYPWRKDLDQELFQ